MAKQLIPEELDLLIQEYLTDGIITDKEREVLLRKAEKLGLDVEEVNLYINAQQQKVDQEVDAAARKKRGQTCPFCGGSVPQFTDKCPHCGQHITAEASDELKEIIDQLEEALVELKSGTDVARSKANVEKYIRKAQLYYSNNPKIIALIGQVKQESEIAEKKAKSNATKHNIIKILTYNKKLTVVTILLIIFLIGYCVNAIRYSFDAVENPTYCLEQIDKAIAKGDLKEADELIKKFKEGKDLIKEGIRKFMAASIDNGDFGVTETYSWYMTPELNQKVKDKTFESGNYLEADIFVTNGSSFAYTDDLPDYVKIVEMMKNSGMSTERIKDYIDQKIEIAQASPHTTTIESEHKKAAKKFKSTLYPIIGLDF